MKILFDHQIFSIRQYGGISRYFVELASQLAMKPDIQLQIVSPLIRSQYLAEHRSRVPTLGMDVSHSQSLPLRVVRPINALLFRAVATLSKPDIVHETYYARAKTAPGSAKIVTTIHDAIPERLPDLFPQADRHKADRRIILARADRVICVSESTRRDLLELYDVDPARVSVALLGSSIAPTTEHPMDIGASYFLHVGSRYRYKNFNALIQAFGEAGLYRTHKLVSFSSHPLVDRELNAMERAGVPRSRVVQVSGNDQILARYYAGAEALVFPSLYEGFGIPVLEAMRCGCPVVTSNTSSLPEVAGDAAIYFDPRDVKSISNALLQMASSPEMRALSIAKGLARAQEFSWKRCAAETYTVYKELLSQR